MSTVAKIWTNAGVWIALDLVAYYFGWLSFDKHVSPMLVILCFSASLTFTCWRDFPQGYRK